MLIKILKTLLIQSVVCAIVTLFFCGSAWSCGDDPPEWVEKVFVMSSIVAVVLGTWIFILVFIWGIK